MHQKINKTGILISGAGPTGLMMACQLAIHQIPFRIIEKKDKYSDCSGALIIHARTLEIFDQMGIATQAIQNGIIAEKINIIFNGNRPLSFGLKNMGKDLTKFPFFLLLKQSKTEELLANFLSNYNHSIEKNTSLLHFSQDQETVISTLKQPDGTEEILKSSYLIAADGSQSNIRNQLNIPFPGKKHDLSLFVFDGKAGSKLNEHEIWFSFSKYASTGIFPLGDGKWRIDGTISGELKSRGMISFTDIEKDFNKRTFTDMKLHQPEWFSVFHAHQHYAVSYRLGRCFLIGDAAHVLSPVGAQGMNTGIQDAFNLAWKLSFVIGKKANPSLLESYHIERQPISKKLVLSTDWSFQLVSGERFLTKRFRLCIAPVLLKIIFPMIEKQNLVSRFLFKGISQIGIHYRKSSFSKHSSRGIFPGHAPKPGDRMPFIIYNDASKPANIQDKITIKCYHLILFTKHSSMEKYLVIAEKYINSISTEIILYTTGTKNLYHKLGIRNEGCYLIRPDNHIAYRSNKPDIEHFNRFLGKIT